MNTKNLKLIVTSDDLWLTKGVNYAVLKASNEWYLTHASLMANTPYFEHAVNEIIPNAPTLQVGVHLNLTNGTSLSGSPYISRNGKLNNTFASLLLRRKSKKVLQAIEQELEMQILKIQEKWINISHFDWERHIHIIPSINKIVRKLAKKYNISRIREINEDLWTVLKSNKKPVSKINYIKFFLLRFLSLFNKNTKKVGFYSIINTCELNEENLFTFLEHQTTYTQIEIMLHPSITEYDDLDAISNKQSRDYLKSPHRKWEFDLCFSEKFKNYVN